jgi:hypothetical protein
MNQSKTNRLINMFLFSILLMYCNAKQEAISQNSEQIMEYNPICFKLVQGTQYRTVYTKNNLDTCIYDYSNQFLIISDRRNDIILFYNNLELTPKEFEIEDINKMINSSSIGGIERIKGVQYYKLIVKNGKIVREIIPPMDLTKKRGNH